MIERSLSTRIDRGDLNHNNRSIVTKNVKQDRINDDIIICQRSLKRLYHDLFDEALQEYNNRQTRKDRRIQNYREYIRHSRQEKEFHEVLFQIGNMKDTDVDSDLSKEASAILEEFARSFEERNPHLKVFNAVIHMDEETPHLHLDFVPVTDEARKNGMRVRNSLTGALRQQSFAGTGNGYIITIDWLEHEKEFLGQIMLEHGIEWVDFYTHEKHRTVSHYKAKKLSEEIKQKTAQLDEVQQELDKAAKKKTKLTEIDSVTTGKTVFGGKVTVSQEDWENISDLAKKQVASQKQTKKLRKERDEAMQKYNALKVKYDATTLELAVYKKKEEEKRYFSREKLNEQTRQISDREKLHKALVFISVCGLSDDFVWFKFNKSRGSELE